MLVWYELAVVLTDPATGETKPHVEHIDLADVDEARKHASAYLGSVAGTLVSTGSFVRCYREEIPLKAPLRPFSPYDVITSEQLLTHKGFWYCSSYVWLLRRQTPAELLSVFDTYDRRPNWGRDMMSRIVELVGVRRSIGFVYRVGDVKLAWHLILHHKSELSERHTVILWCAINQLHAKFNPTTRYRYVPSRALILTNLAQRRAVADRVASKRPRRKSA